MRAVRFLREHPSIVLLPFAANLAMSWVLFSRGVSLTGAVGASVVPGVGLLLLYWFLRDGRFYSGFRGGQRLISARWHPRKFWSMVCFVLLWYCAATSLIAIASFAGGQR